MTYLIRSLPSLRVPALACLIFLFASLVNGIAEEEAPPAFLFDGPLINRGDWSQRALSQGDLNGNGRQDLVVINNNRARLEFYRQRVGEEDTPAPRRRIGGRWSPVLEDSHLIPDHLVTGQHMHALALGDLKGNGRTDLAFTTRRQTIDLYEQGEDGSWTETHSLDLEGVLTWNRTLALTDFNQDGRTDLIALTSNRIYLFFRDENGFQEPVTYPLPESNNHGLTLRDLTGNGLPDLLYFVPNHDRPFRFRPQVKAGVLGPEISLAMDNPRALPVFLPLGNDEPEDAHQLVSIAESTGLLQFLRLQRKSPEKTNGTAIPEPLGFALAVSGNQSPSFLRGAFRSESAHDMLVADPGGARIFLFARLAEGGYSTPEIFPSLADIRGLARGFFRDPKKEEIAVASFREEVIGLTSISPGERLGFPSPLPFSGKPTALRSADLSGNGLDDLIVTHQTSGGSRQLSILSWSTEEDAWQERNFPIEGIRADPTDLRIFDANGNGRLDIGIFVPFAAFRIFVQDEQGDFADASLLPGYRSSLVDRLEPSQLSHADINGDGFAEMLVARTGFIRALRLGENNALQIVDQINARSSEDDIALTIPQHQAEDSFPQLLAFVRGKNEFQRFTRDESGVYRFREAQSTANHEPLGFNFSPGLSEEDDLLIFGRRHLWWSAAQPEAWSLEVIDTVESDSPDITFTHLGSGDFNADGQTELLVMDGRSSRSLEIFQRRESHYEPVFFFTLFETSPHFQGRRGSSSEPREVLIGDFTGNGLDDIVLLVHDRILIYPQQPR